MQKISPFLWFDTEAEEAATFYVSVFKNSRITNVSRAPAGGPVEQGQVFGVSFVLDGLEVQALNAGPQFPFTEAISLYVNADTQEEIDDLWEKLTSDGGQPSRCGWLKDRWGLSWQITPPLLGQYLGDSDPEKASRVLLAMMAMQKIEIAELTAAYEGERVAD
jgi:predicted 3-demethylubiquinone-9 3-methyltransferase (glyoxalase superfamily)